MHNTPQVHKAHGKHPIYDDIPLLCPYCLQNQKISRVFKKPYILLYHLTTVHNKEDEISAGISLFETKLAISGVATAHYMKMFFDFPKRNKNFQVRTRK